MGVESLVGAAEFGKFAMDSITLHNYLSSQHLDVACRQLTTINYNFVAYVQLCVSSIMTQ